MTGATGSRPLRVMFATDGSSDARAAAEYLARFPLPTGSSVHVLSVVTVPPSPIAFPGLEELKQSLFAEARRACDEAVDLIRSGWPAVEISVGEGDAREQILRTAEAWKPDLVVLGRRGVGGFERMLVGSVSLTAARHLTCPVLVARGPVRAVRRIVVGVDGSEESRRAVNFVAALRPAPNVDVDLVAVAPSLFVSIAAPSGLRGAFRSVLAEWDAQQQAALRHLLSQAAGQLGEGIRVHVHTPVGDPSRRLIESAATADLVVVGSRGLGAVRRMLLGTVSEKVLQHAPCSVLIVKPGAGPAG